MIETLDQYDKELMLLLNFDGGTWFDNFWYTFSGKFIWIGVYAVILYKFFVLCKAGKVNYKALAWLVVCTALLITLCDQISSGIIKHLVERPRPSHCDEIEGMLHYVNDYRGGRFGFVSSHAANSIGLACWLCLLFRSYIFHCVIIAWSILTCYSRIYLGVHYLGDILGGLCVGIACVFVVHYLYRHFAKEQHQITAQRKEPWVITLSLLVTVVGIMVYAIF